MILKTTFSAMNNAVECGESGGFVGFTQKKVAKGKMYNIKRFLRDGVGLITIWRMEKGRHRRPPSF